MRITRSQSRSVLIGLCIFSLGLWIGWQANNFIAQDICLDRGGAWDDDTRSCRFNPNPQTGLLISVQRALVIEGRGQALT